MITATSVWIINGFDCSDVITHVIEIAHSVDPDEAESAGQALSRLGIHLFDVEIAEQDGGGDSIRFVGTKAQFMAHFDLTLGDGAHRVTGHVERNGRVLDWTHR